MRYRIIALFAVLLQFLLLRDVFAEKIGEITLACDSLVQELIETDLVRYKGVTLEAGVVDDIARRLISDLSDGGHPFAQARVVRLDELNGSIDLQIELNPGPVCRFNRASIIGLDQRTTAFLDRMSPIKDGAIFSERAIRSLERSFTRYDFVKLEDSVELEFDDSYTRCTPLVTMKRIPTNLIEGSVGYQPGFAGRAGYVKGFGRIEVSNPFGRARKMTFDYVKKDPYSHAIAIEYYQPNIFYSPLSTTIEASQLKQDSLYQSLEGSSSLGYTLRDISEIAFHGGWSKRTPLGSAYRGVFHSRRWWWGVSIGIKDLSGSAKHDLSTEIRFGTRQLYQFAGVMPEKSRVDDTRISGRYSISLTHSRLLSSTAKIMGAGIRSDESVVPVTELYRLGGVRTLRGYREEQFLCERFVLVSYQPEIALAFNTRFHVFGDGAWLKPDIGRSLVRSGAGFGIEFDLPNGMLMIETAWGHLDRLSDGKIYAIIESRF